MIAERIQNEKHDANVAILGEPLKFPNGKTSKNRFLKAAMTERVSSSSPDILKRGIPTQHLLNMYERWGNGGFGMVMTGNVITHPEWLECPGNIVISKENYSRELCEELKKLAEVMKADGALAVVQLGSAARLTPTVPNERPDLGMAVMGTPVNLTTEEVKTEIVDRFVFAAKVCHEAGFDGVEIHGARGFILSSFLTVYTNDRSDKYGGSLENRARPIMEIFEAIRNGLPKDFVVGLKITSPDFHTLDNQLSEDVKPLLNMIEAKGFDFVEIGGGHNEKTHFKNVRESTLIRRRLFEEFNALVRSHLRQTKVYCTGGFRTITGAVEAVENGECDGIGMARPVAAEPDLPKKILYDGIASASDVKLEPLDYQLTKYGASAQMVRSGKKSLKEANGDLMFDIPDLSDRETCEKFKVALKKYMEENRKSPKGDDHIHQIFDFKEYDEKP